MLRRSMLTVLIGLIPSIGFAQTYNRVISFGDSLTDNGNLFALTGQPPLPYNKRFTNGQTFAEYLAGGFQSGFGTIGPGSVNYAFGGARNDNNANTNGPIPSTIRQIATFQAFGGTYGANDIVTYWAGANNLFQATTAAAAAPATALATVGLAATAAGVQSGLQVGAIAGQGAKTIVIMNLPNFASLPAYAALGPQGAGLGTFASTTFDASQNQAVLAAAAANRGTNFIQVDQAAVFAAVLANPGAFGFSDVTTPCFNLANLTCAFASKAVQNQHLFWDTVHPTDAGHRLLAAIIGDYIYTPSRVADVAALGDSSLWSRRATTLDMLDKARTITPQGDKIEYFASIAGVADQRNYSTLGQSGVGVAASTTNTKYSGAMGGLRFGGFKNIGQGWTGGFGVSALTGDLKANLVSASPTALSVDLTSNWRANQFYLLAQAGASLDVYSNYKRQMSIAAFNQSGSTDGYSASTSLEAGYDFGFANITVTPAVRLGYLYTQVSAFNESSAIASVGFDGRSVQGLTGAVELRASAKLSALTSVNGLIGYEDFLSKSSQAIRGQLINNTALPFATATNGLTGAGFVFGVGAQTNLGGWVAGLSYRGSAGQKSQVTHQGEIKLSYAW